MTHKDKAVLYLCERCLKILPAEPEPKDCLNCGSPDVVALVKQWKVRAE